jgi:hypothetical protein
MTEPSFHVLKRIFLETDLEARYDKEIFPFFTIYHFIYFHWLHLPSSSVGRNWYTTVITENQLRDAKNTPTVCSLGRN